MAFRNLWEGVRNFFGPNNTFFNGVKDEPVVQREENNRYPQQNAPQQQQPVQPQQQPYQPAAYPQQNYSNQPYNQTVYQQPQQAPVYQQPVQNQQQNWQQQGYQPPQNMQPPRAHRAEQPAQMAENVVPFPGNAPVQTTPAAQGTAPADKPISACVVNTCSIADCRNAIAILRAGDCVLAVLDNIADQAEVRRYVDTLNGACFSLGCTMTRLSARVGVYLLAPANMQVYTDQRTTQMNSQSRVPQRPQRSAPSAYQTPYQQQPTQQGYAAPYQAQMAFSQQQAYAAPQTQPSFSQQQPAQGYAPDQDGGNYHEAVM